VAEGQGRGRAAPAKKTSDRPVAGGDDKIRNGGQRRRRTNGSGQPGKGRRTRYDGPLYAALDLGTNNCRLLVARPSRRGFLVVDAFSRIIRLGEGVSQSGRLSDDAMRRTLEALAICSEKMLKRGVARSRLIATEACRIACNGQVFLERVRHETGLSLEIVSRETEAKLAVSGCASLLDRSCDWALVFDIGGGSSELIWLDLSRMRKRGKRWLYDRIDAQDCIVAWTSLPVGVVTLAEQFGGRNVGTATFDEMVSHVLHYLREFETEYAIARYTANARTHLLGTSGTVTTVAGIHLGLKRYDRRRVDGCWLRTNQVRRVSKRLAAMSYPERVAEPCIGAERADMVLAGCAILEALMRMWPSDRLRVADRGLREGILASLMAEDGVLRDGPVKTGRSPWSLRRDG